MRSEHIFFEKIIGVNSIHILMIALYSGKNSIFTKTLQLRVYTDTVINSYFVISFPVASE